MYKRDFENAKLTEEQKKCVNFSSGDLLIKGVAGSGKSYVILKRAIKLYNKKLKEEKVVIFTYTNSLVKYTNDLISSKVGEGEIEVLTIDSYCMKLFYKIYNRPFIRSKDDVYKEIIEKSLDEHQKKSQLNHRLYEVNISFFEEEFKWIREKCITSKKEYISTDRKGRGSQIRLSNSDKELVWGIYALFAKRAKMLRYRDWPDLYMALVKKIDNIPEDMKIDYVLIDEAQDMTVGKLKVIKALSRKSLTIAADIAQKIYKTSFTWKEVGIDISGRSSKSLSKSFRSTKQIVELAEDLMKENRKHSKVVDEYTDVVYPDVEGDKPRVSFFDSKTEENLYLVELLKKYPIKKEVIGVICRTQKTLYSLRSLIQKNGLDCETVKKSSNGDMDWSLLKPGIKLVIAHSSKGLEFERVIIPYLNDSEYPFKSYKIDDNQLEEYLQIERSILYVAMTRARSSLVMLCEKNAYSRFIDEFESEHYIKENI